MHADELISTTIKMAHNNINSIVVTLYGYIIFDYIMGQRDRHLGNLAILKNKQNGGMKLYSLYDNGYCCFSTEENDRAIDALNKRFYSSRMGESQDIASTINKYRNIIYPSDLRGLIRYDKLNDKTLDYYITKADKYKQVNKERKEATIKFILKNAQDIHKINLRTFKEEDLYV